ncbi:42bfe0f3-2a1e-427a-abd4-501fd34ef7a8 [Sclerotinia trifoliorum]|uniref:42bfe0f3-2a1e-427a-abd4-501fd34ef7a8 n=1 Tax=Sclerotinia trifoliorum TaxID=28548 RepID=A0A8H2ZQK7_9HELO|nr:42bfe0f3-2a1e-427a-abd4-501fd34ef7a8 [Sclerotinia trifoliorum]
MADSNNKRKERSEGSGGKDARDARDGNNRGVKRAKGGSNGKWQTPHQQTKMASKNGGRIEPGDQGIWATCVKGKEGKATEELRSLLEESAEKYYGISVKSGSKNNDEEDEVATESIDDIEKSIQKEVAAHKDPTEKLFSAVYLDIQCVLFFKTRSPIDPADLVHRMCEDAASGGVRKLRFVNRLTPMSIIGKATEKGIEEIGQTVLGAHFRLAGEAAESEESAAYSYAIRPTIRNHSTLKRDTVIKQVASLVNENHKVNLTKPDKVIIIEIYQTICGMSVVGDDWEKLKRYNLYELQSPSTSSKSGGLVEAKPKPTPESVTTDEARALPDKLNGS